MNHEKKEKEGQGITWKTIASYSTVFDKKIHSDILSNTSFPQIMRMKLTSPLGFSFPCSRSSISVTTFHGQSQTIYFIELGHEYNGESNIKL